MTITALFWSMVIAFHESLGDTVFAP